VTTGLSVTPRFLPSARTQQREVDMRARLDMSVMIVAPAWRSFSIYGSHGAIKVHSKGLWLWRRTRLNDVPGVVMLGHEIDVQ